jgi:thiol-disulfide isomerase/thioredoxin
MTVRVAAWIVALALLPEISLGADGAKRSYDFELYDLGDRLLSLKKLRAASKLVVVDFFAESCAPCKAALPAWRELQRRYAARGLTLVVVAVPDDASERSAARERVARYFKQHPVGSPIAWDKYQLVARQYGVARQGALSVPQVFLLDGAGALQLRSEKVAPVRAEIERRLR